MKTPKRTFPRRLMIPVILLSLLLCGCGKYPSRYRAVGFVHSNTSDSASMSFYSFDGCISFRLKGSSDGQIRYSAALESGSATVYYDYIGVKAELFTIRAGEEVSSFGGYVGNGTVYLIVETDEPCRNGSFRFSLGAP